MLDCDFWIWSVQLTIQVTVGAGPPAVIVHITSAVRAAALLAVAECVPPLQPAVLPLLHRTADVWQQWARGESHEENGRRQKSKAVFSPVSVAVAVKPGAGVCGTWPGDLDRPCSPLSTTRLHRDSGCPCKSARTTGADVSWRCWTAAGNDGHHTTASRQLPLPPTSAPYVPRWARAASPSRFSCEKMSPAVSDPAWTWPLPPASLCALTNASEVASRGQGWCGRRHHAWKGSRHDANKNNSRSRT